MDPTILTAIMQGGMYGGGGFGGALPGLLQGLFGQSGRPYEKARDAYMPYFNQATGYQQPYLQAGNQAVPQYQDWLKGMQDPSGFINSQMGKYQESPWAHNLQTQAIRAGQNMGSASGLSGSTPLMQQMEQNASNISSQDQNQWLQNVLGVNTQYGQGLNNLMGGGQNAANALMHLLYSAAGDMGNMAYGQEAGRQQDRNALFGGISNFFGG